MPSQTQEEGTTVAQFDVLFYLIVVAGAVLLAGWFVLLHRFHRGLDELDPQVSQRIGKPSLFWTAFNGDARMIELISRKDLARTKYAHLAPLALLIRIWAFLMCALFVVAWACSPVAN